jgi:hypothetical protein
MKLIHCTDDEVKVIKNLKGLILSWGIPVNPKKVEIDGEIVALIDFSFGGIYGDDSIEIDNFEVIEKGKGIGSKIIVDFLNICENRIVSLYPDNERCKKFWLEYGFEIEYEGGDVERLVYKKLLTYSEHVLRNQL